ncbi:hypothetical protein BCIN_09g03080 [Botrytis cinerea B05.10]|uniref:Uncharacterized protein n=1 Tax=Botryotinia fuckeliana (strain B05.10) TaxID=332648 RepID=A0A384JSI9_BOTFB|nr:hypothetical protein BCIN_09g03080 [Botrytis cinerea B05.10]ATZ53462.1 hypothetical protein BCIN_09g03080 [Botrytis cinerea B05.10]
MPLDHPENPEQGADVAGSIDESKGVAAFHPRRHGLFQGYQSSGGENISPNTASEGSDPPAFDAAEHKWLGDNILLATGINGRNCYRAGTKAFTLPNTVKLTYGEICLLAGDFFGTSSPISDGKDDADRTKRFEDAWETLAEYKRSDAKDILKILQPELDAVNRAFKEHRDPSDEYSKLKNVDWDLERATARMWKFGFPTYFQLASYNWDHFGDDAYTCYKVGHAAAIKYARTHHGDVNGLNQAYAMNAFADHFLQDIFSAGHVRTPRRQLHRPLFPYYPDMCAKMMHDEDCAIGLSVKDSSGKAWTMYGDKRLLDDANSDNFGRCQEAVQTSADEIYDAWIGTKKTSDFKALDLAPTLESALGTDQKLAPLFKVQGNEVLRRENIKDRRNHTSTTPSWSYRGTYDECGKSGWWKHPITLDGPSA